MDNQYPKPLIFFTTDRPYCMQVLRKLPRYGIGSDWHGTEINPYPSFSLGLDPKRLWLYATIPFKPNYDTSLACGSYTPNLWQKDIAEIFICEHKTSRYQEFNISPSGAWWSMLFSEYRKPDEENFRMPDCQCIARPKEDSWEVALGINRRTLSIKSSFSRMVSVNVAFVLGDGERKYISWGECEGEKPDFHRTEFFDKAGQQRVIYSDPTEPEEY